MYDDDDNYYFEPRTPLKPKTLSERVADGLVGIIGRLIVLALAGGMIYGFVKFVKWAWEN